MISCYILGSVMLLLVGGARDTSSAQPMRELSNVMILHSFVVWPNIHATALGPNIVKIDWTQASGANKSSVQEKWRTTQS